MSKCDECPSKTNCNKTESTCSKFKKNEEIKKIIAVMSGKGGVGKSSCCVMLAKQMQKQGYKVGILDADITGPSIPRLLGLEKATTYAADNKIIPIEDENKIQVMSLNFLIEKEDAPVLWRGPLITNALRQFYEEVAWKDLDYLFIDMPPGTGDVALTIFQMYPINGVIMISTPQPMVSMIVAKAIHMCNQMQIPIYGLIENMSYLMCDNCSHKIRMYEENEVQSFLSQYNLELLAELPMNASIANMNKQNNQFNEEIQIILKQAISKLIAQLSK